MGKKKNANSAVKKRKLFVEFNEQSRKDYVTGMSRRRQQRKQEALEHLKEKVKQERKEAVLEHQENLLEERKKAMERKKALMEAQGELYSEDEDEEDAVNSDDENKNAVSELTGKDVKVDKKQIEDEFSKKMFGSSTVTITTTKLESDDEDDEKVNFKPGLPSSAASVILNKNTIVTPGNAEKTLQRLMSKKVRRKLKLTGKTKTVQSKKARVNKRKKGKTTAGERRRR